MEFVSGDDRTLARQAPLLPALHGQFSQHTGPYVLGLVQSSDPRGYVATWRDVEKLTTTGTTGAVVFGYWAMFSLFP